MSSCDSNIALQLITATKCEIDYEKDDDPNLALILHPYYSIMHEANTFIVFLS